MSRLFMRKSYFALGAGVILVGYLLPTVITAVRYGSAFAFRPVVILSWILLIANLLLAALCYAEIASTVPVEGSNDTVAYAATQERFTRMLGWPLLLAFAANFVALAVIALRSLGLSDFLPIDELIHLANIATLFGFVVVCVTALFLRKKYPTAERTFRWPGGPVVPILGILISLLLMLSLPTAAWLRLISWLAIGGVLYFAYGRRRRSPTQAVGLG
ncbi:MAG TPA: amino acid permease C-terminal domain-containing protein [Thermoanaerobaculia bacterium]|jgi:amino acid transporter|nr:amino acid permease C-terminal domain-containing protein [Thermoanaerobaculia bacterium]